MPERACLVTQERCRSPSFRSNSTMPGLEKLAEFTARILQRVTGPAKLPIPSARLAW